jgi:indole-3-glycerol phosphate synthase
MPATLLHEIAERRRAAIEQRRRELGNTPPARPESIGPARRGAFRAALARPSAAAPLRFLCELKKASPSRGLIRPDFAPADLARAYAAGGASALSVLTEPDFFQGAPAYLTAARIASGLPCLLKDFVLDPWQIDEAHGLGADAVLLIVALLPLETLRRFLGLAQARGLDALVEVHTETELELALAAGADLVGINNRDLTTFEVDPAVTTRLRAAVPAGVPVVSESGIATADDVTRLTREGVDAALVGEAFMRQPDVGAAVAELVAAAGRAAAAR